uniref:Uncharacterized protein n=1 Tax=Globodera rostochiensis TaxID=31243 RepID=A0A914H432_GLORO
MKDEFKQKGKYSAKEWVQIEEKIAANKYANSEQKELMKRYYKRNWDLEFGKCGNENLAKPQPIKTPTANKRNY